MNLGQFRTLFRTISGRYDLVASNGADNGANFHINAGQKYLDRLADLPARIGRRFIDVTANSSIVTFEQCRSILEVWIEGPIGSGEATRTKLTYMSHDELKQTYGDLPANITPGPPKYYAPVPLRLVTDSVGLTGGIGGFMDVVADGHETFNGIQFMPPTDDAYSVEIIGNFYSLTLSADEDTSYWLSQHSDILVMATMRQLEIFHRNREGVADWTSAIADAVATLDMDGVAEETTTANVMEG